ncbi:MAG: methyltransferase domain-containing protein [Lachnospiraceae bacterium]|nr:methyltransferase domain-containing protein [Lachnospiraceae bacterium]
MIQANYRTYLRRMTESYDNTTKSLIPFYTAQAVKHLEKPMLLDVGIGSGVVGKGLRAMIPDAVICGIDMVKKNIEDAPPETYDILAEGRFEEYDGEGLRFDAVIFSSVLHEIGSYAEEGRFTAEPIRLALIHACELLSPGGVIVIREGLAESDANAKEKVCAVLEHEEDAKALLRFYQERPLSEAEISEAEETAGGEEALRTAPQCTECSGGFSFTLPRDVLREYLCTWTWGEKSWPREIQERFCYLSAQGWERLLTDCGLDVITNIQSSEEYPKYFKKIIRNFESASLLVGVFVGRKK